MQIYFSLKFIKIEAYTKPKKSDLCVLNWKSLYDVMLFMCKSRQQHFAEFWFVWFLDQGICKNTFLCSVLHYNGDNCIVFENFTASIVVFNGRKYPFTVTTNTSPVNSICDHQIFDWCREIFKYNSVIS